MRPTLELLVEPLEHVGRLQVLDYAAATLLEVSSPRLRVRAVKR
jgi:hypothetical protein